MWKNNDQSISSGDESLNLLAGRDINFFYEGNYPKELVDQKIVNEVEKLRKARFFVEFDRITSSLALGSRLAKRELSGGSDEIRCQGLAWCARLLTLSDELDKAEEFLELAKTLANCPEIKFAEAFVISQKGDKTAALQTLGVVAMPFARGETPLPAM